MIIEDFYSYIKNFKGICMGIMRNLFLALSLFIIFSIGKVVAQSSWSLEELAPLPQSISNNAVTSGIVDGKTYVYSFGGIDSTKIFSGLQLSAYRLDVAANVWETLDEMPDPRGGKIASSADRIGDTIYIVGGYHVASNLSEVTSRIVHRFDLRTNKFVDDAATLPIAIDDQSQVVHDDKLYVVSGWSVNTNRRNVQVYDPTTDTWEGANLLENNNSYKVFGSSGAILGNDIYYYGGATLAGSFNGSNVLRKGSINPNNPLDIDWKITTPMDSPIGYRVAAVATDGLIHFIGGSNVTYNFDGIAYNGTGGVNPSETILSYDPNNPTEWIKETIPNLPMDLRSLAQINENTFVIVGGMEANQKVSNKTYKLTFLGIPNSIEDKKSDSIYAINPNPVQDKLDITSSSFIKEILINNNKGEKVYHKSVNNFSHIVDIYNWLSGTYYIQIIDHKGNIEATSFLKI